MGQSSIAMLNKVGYSMFWNSMWDNKVDYSRLLKEDIFLDKFFSVSFNDSLSANLILLKNKNIKNYKIYNYNFDNKKNSLYRYFTVNSKINYFSSKLWVLKYQKWVIIYNFIYISNFDKFYIKSTKEKNPYKSNFMYVVKYYNKANFKIKNNLNKFKSQYNFKTF